MSNRSILIIVPKLTDYGGLELENIGFINALVEKSDLKVKVLSIEINKESKALINNNTEFVKLKNSIVFKCLSVWFFKVLIKSKFNFKKTIRTYLSRYPQLLDPYLFRETKVDDIIFCSLHPQKIVRHIQQFCNEYKRQFVFHQISEPHQKYSSFYQSLTKKDVVLISSDNKLKEISRQNNNPNFRTIKQWIYTNENEFLNLNINSEQQVKFGVISRLDKEKNIQLLLQATKLLDNDNFKVIIYGNGNEAKSLKSYTSKHKLDDKIIFKGSIHYNNRFKAYQNIDVFVCTSISEGGPITVLEAMATGMPVISTNVGDVPNRVINDHNGFVLNDNDDDKELSQLMLKYINKPKLVDSHGKNGRNRYLNEYHSKVSKDLFVSVLL
ncbi:glycosyltransferase [Flavobacterium sp. CS20]|uniref:glycosyltransferase n=1 Tax=Flavobacterium sp. CS20 TaxID=2775246 RepID=UPI001B39E278|nr:glycosyltransferase [Flavobacterium sp. CS20]QTY28144.1 glycosyltransferase family 4 protein [Flavobacterium sp. CS20]